MIAVPGAATQPLQPCPPKFIDLVLIKPPDHNTTPTHIADMIKRKRNIANDPESTASKRLSTGQSLTAPSISYGGVDPTYGQRSAFPGLDDNNESRNGYDADGNLEDDVTPDALSYLQDVR
jgi:hypothetical protein